LGKSLGGWCLPCILFLTDDEKANLGAFVCTPFKNCNKSKELMERHAKHAYHVRAVNNAFEFTRRWINPESRIENHIIDKILRIFNLILKYCQQLLKQFYYAQNSELLYRVIIRTRLTLHRNHQETKEILLLY